MRKRLVLIPVAAAALFLAGLAACVYAGISDPLFSVSRAGTVLSNDNSASAAPVPAASECSASRTKSESNCSACPDCPDCPDCPACPLCPATGAKATSAKTTACTGTACTATSNSQ